MWDVTVSVPNCSLCSQREHDRGRQRTGRSSPWCGSSRELERACTDLTLPQYRLLALIVRGEERASGLAGQLALARPTVSAAVETLVANGMVERTSVDGDRRAIRLTITPAGRARAAKSPSGDAREARRAASPTYATRSSSRTRSRSSRARSPPQGERGRAGDDQQPSDEATWRSSATQ